MFASTPRGISAVSVHKHVVGSVVDQHNKSERLRIYNVRDIQQQTRACTKPGLATANFHYVTAGITNVCVPQDFRSDGVRTVMGDRDQKGVQQETAYSAVVVNSFLS